MLLRATRAFVAWLATCVASPTWMEEPGLAQEIPPPDGAEERKFEIVGTRFTGLSRTDPEWLAGYIDLTFPAMLTESDAKRIATRLLTTAVFTMVKVTYEKVAEGGSGAGYVLHVHVEEKWTTIPVVRGVYGGGTPLTVLGIYDIHAFGRLLTLGAEARKYGDAPPGFVLFGRDPRHDSGRYYIGGEFWREFRLRQVYDDDGEMLGRVATNSTISRVRLLQPLALGPDVGRVNPWKVGLELEAVQVAPGVFDPETGSETPPEDLGLGKEAINYVSTMPIVQYDDIDADNLVFDGLRAEWKVGPMLGAGRPHTRSQVESYFFQILPSDLNFGLHALAGVATLNSLQSQYFLGGLDSIRGLPDGALHGTRAAYANAELRHTSFKMKYVWVQSVAFVDAGGAGQTWEDARAESRATAGIGVRFAVPQIYRFAIRIDYAWSIDGEKAQGITAGMNQFFEPYRPL